MKLFVKLIKLIRLGVYFLWQLLLSNIKIAQCVLGPERLMQPGIIAIPLTVKTDLEIFLLANAITLTPGSLTVDVSADHQFLYVHGMQIGDAEAYRRDIKEGFERMILEVFQ